nr:hypothetical protein [Saprospiraceae bacterium]
MISIFVLASVITSILYSLLVFCGIILGMSYMLIYARKQLLAQGDVKLIINGDEDNPILVK